MPIIPTRPIGEFEALQERASIGENLTDPLLQKDDPAPGFIENAFISFRTNSITGTLGQEIGHAFKSPSSERDPNFDPYKEFFRDPQFMAEHPYLIEDFEFDRMLDIPNREAFFYHVARKKEDFELRQRGSRGGFVSGLVGAVGPDAGLFAVTGGGAVKGVAPFKTVSSEVGAWLAEGNAAIRTLKVSALASVANVTNEGVLAFINEDRNVDDAEAFRDAAIWGAALGAAIPLGGKLLGAGRERLMDTRAGMQLKTRFKDMMVTADMTKGAPAAIQRSYDEAVGMLAQTPVGNRVIAPLTVDVAEALGVDGKILAQAKETGVMVQKLKEATEKAGFTLEIQRHPYQDYLDIQVHHGVLDAQYRQVAPTGIFGRGAAALNSILPGGKARNMPSFVAKFFNHTFFDDAALLAGSADDPVNFKVNPSAESLKHGIERIHAEAVKTMHDVFNSHFKNKGDRITATLSDNTQINVGAWGGTRQFREAVTDYLYQADEVRRGVRDSISITHPAIREAAEKTKPYFADMFDRLDQAKLLRGPRALKATQDQLTELTGARKLIDDELAAIGPAPVGPPTQAKSATTRSPGYKAAYKQRLAELEAVMPGDKANKASAKELAKQDVQKALDEQAAKVNAEIDAYAAKKAEIDGRAAKLDEQTKAIQAQAKEIEGLIAAAENYHPRRWLAHKIRGNKADFTGRLTQQWQRNRNIDPKTGKPLAERPIIDEALDRLPAEDRKIIREAGDEAKIPAELRDPYEAAISQYYRASADAVYDKLTHLDNAHGIISAMDSMPDSLKARVLQIDETQFRDYLDNDIQSVMRSYDHQMSGRIAVRIAIDQNAGTWAPLVKDLTGEVFDGSTEQIIRTVGKHFDKLANDAADDASRALAEKGRKQMTQIMDLKFAELQGRRPEGTGSAAADAGWTAAGSIASKMPYLAYMGKGFITNLMDLAAVVMMTGLDSRKIGLLAKQFKREPGSFLPQMSLRGLEGFASALDQMGMRQMELMDATSHPSSLDPAPTRLGRGLQAADRFTGAVAGQFGVVTGMNWLTNFSNRAAATLILDEVVNGAKKMSKARALIKGGMTEAKAFHQVGLAIEDAQRLNRMGFNADEADKLIDVLTTHAEGFEGKRPWTDRDSFMEHKGHINPNYSKWYDSDRDMFDRLTSAVDSEVRNIVVRPKALSRPFMNAHWIGRAIHQFWGFAYAWSNQLAVAVSQRPGREQALYFTSLMGLAAVSDSIHNHISGRRTFAQSAELWANPETSMSMVYKTIDRSGVLGWLSRPLGIADREGFGLNKLLRGDNVSSRFIGNSGRAGYLSPLFDYGENLISGSLGVVTKGDATSWHRLRKTMAGQNLLALEFIYRTTKDMGLDNPIGPGQGLDLFPLPTRPIRDINRVEPEPEP